MQDDVLQSSIEESERFLTKFFSLITHPLQSSIEESELHTTREPDELTLGLQSSIEESEPGYMCSA